MIQGMSSHHTEFLIAIDPGEMAMRCRWATVVTGLVRPISAPAARSGKLERLIVSA